MQPTVNQNLQKIPFLNTPQELNDLKVELPTYLERASDTNENFDILEWWKRNSSHLRKWSAAAKRNVLIQLSFTAAERVFKNSFGDKQDNANKLVEASLMLQYNSR